ncbi:MAG: toprim domain-containing protein [Oligoflexia bacterium]
MTDTLLGAVAELLGLPSAPLVRLGVGWSPSDRATTWPMRNGSGDVIGIRLRCPKTASKWSVKGSAHGLFYCPSLLSVERPERLWIVEGNTDAAAILSLGFDVVGVPSAGGGCDLLIDLARRILPGEVVVLADSDDSGRRGAERIADAMMIVAPVRIVSPPQGIKDSRSWVVSGASRKAIESAADAATVRRIAMEGR